MGKTSNQICSCVCECTRTHTHKCIPVTQIKTWWWPRAVFREEGSSEQVQQAGRSWQRAWHDMMEKENGLGAGVGPGRCS